MQLSLLMLWTFTSIEIVFECGTSHMWFSLIFVYYHLLKNLQHNILYLGGGLTQVNYIWFI